jgi:pimeloyl-ACP methyl ester carboxylesterase
MVSLEHYDATLAGITTVEFVLPTGVVVSGWRHRADLWQKGQPWLLCLHGWQDNAHSFLPLANALPEQAMLCIDFAGHGQSSRRSPDAAYPMVDYAVDIVMLLQQIAGEIGLRLPLDPEQMTQRKHTLTSGQDKSPQQPLPCAIVGHSMGAMVASLVAAWVPHWIPGLILLDALAIFTVPDDAVVSHMQAGLKARLAPQLPPMVYSQWSQLLKVRQRYTPDLDTTALHLLALRGSTKTDAGWYWHVDPKVRAPSIQRFSAGQVRQLLASVRCPIMAWMAANGPFLAAARDYIDVCSDIVLHTYDGHHHAHMTQSAELALLIHAFLPKLA